MAYYVGVEVTAANQEYATLYTTASYAGTNGCDDADVFEQESKLIRHQTQREHYAKAKSQIILSILAKSNSR